VLECVLLGNGELLVNVTDRLDIAEVMHELSEHWSWDSSGGPIAMPGEEEEGPTEWLVLMNARPRVVPQAAA
jgi:hypothetical protein